MKLDLVRWLSAALVLGCGGTSQAAVIFDGFGAGDSFEQPRIVSRANDDVVRSGVIVGQDLDWALAFTPTADAVLDSIEIALSAVSDANEVDIFLRTDDAGRPGALLEGFHLSGALVPTGSIQTFASAVMPLLSSGVQYWIEMSAGIAGTATVASTGWNSSTGAASPRAEQLDEGLWASSGNFSYAYRVNGTLVDVPEPGSTVLLGIGLAILSLRVRRTAG